MATKRKPNYVQIYRSRDGQWRFRVKSRNHEVVAQGEGYTRRSSARRGASRAFPALVQVVEAWR